MHGKERSDGIFIFLTTRKKNSLFSAFTNIQLQCLIAWSKKTQVVIAYIQRLFLWEILVHFLSQTKHLIALECFTFFFFASYGLTETARTTVFVWRKSSDADYLGTLDVGASGGISVKALFFFHFTNMQTVCTRSTGRNAGASSLRRRSAYLDALKSTVHTVPLRLFHLFHNTTRLLQSRSDRVGMNASRVLKRTYYAFWYFLFICRCTWKLLQCWMLILNIAKVFT